MGHIWLIYGLYMGYLTKYTMVALLQGVYENLIAYLFVKEKPLQYI
ncbi:hypothetical protein SAMN04488121_1011230 [Chitinophaga filiformis]|uniref:Uncharacterized protein n=1 Tax=Chitinophaga filiformis TaxID=104663 RepID=A0A1G7JGH6_CHIFI|nr:hypothetical protein SAMN04488121_1011230 [Chitinophaga filiformis]